MTILDRGASSKNKEDNAQARQASTDNGNSNRKQRTRVAHASRDRTVVHGPAGASRDNGFGYWPDPTVAVTHRNPEFAEAAHMQLQHDELSIRGPIKPRGLSKSAVVVQATIPESLQALTETATVMDDTITITSNISQKSEPTHSVPFCAKTSLRNAKKSSEKKVSHKKKRRNVPYQSNKAVKGPEKLNAQIQRSKLAHTKAPENSKIAADASNIIPHQYTTSTLLNSDSHYHKGHETSDQYHQFGSDDSGFVSGLDRSDQFDNLTIVPAEEVSRASSIPLENALGAPNCPVFDENEEVDSSDAKNNSDDEYDQGRIKRLHQGMDFRKLETEFEEKLKKIRGFIIKPMEEDGACLFRAVADQVYGDQSMHDEVRKNCMNYMNKNADYFSNYVTEDFQAYINRKRNLHEFGNHLEMQAMAELYNRPFEVYQYRTDPINTFQTSHPSANAPIRVSYHQNSHYNSVIDPYVATIGVGLGLPSFNPGLVDKTMLNEAVEASCEVWEQQMLNDKVQATDWETTDDAILEQVARESYMEYIEHKASNIGGLEPGKADETEFSRLAIETKGPSKAERAKVVKEFPKKPNKVPNPSASDWVAEEDEWQVLSQVLVNSQQEYMDALKHQATHSRATCSKYT